MSKILRITSLVTVFVLLFSFASFSADAATKNGFEYIFIYDDNGIATIEITGYSGAGNVRIPSKINGYTVSSIGKNAFRRNKKIKSINLGSSVSEVNDSAFRDCTNLSKIVLGNVKFISQDAFKNCSKLTSVKIPDTLIGVTGDAFSGCKSLKRFTVESNNYFYESYKGILIKKGTPYIVAYPQAKGEVYKVPAGIVGIGAGAFKDNKKIRKVIIKNDVQTIGENSFEGCSNLKMVNLGESVTRIYSDAFKNCSNLSTVKFPKGLITIDEEAFLGCVKLKRISLYSKVENIGERALGYIRKNERYQRISGVKIIAPKYGNAEKYAKNNNITFKEKSK